MLRLLLIKAVLVAALLPLALPAAAATVHLAVVGDLSGRLTVPGAVWAGQVVGGVLGAIGERAAAAAAAGTGLEPTAQLLPINVTTAAALGAAAVRSQVAATLGAVPTIVAVLAPARGAAAEGTVAACVAAGVPVVGPETTDQAHYVGATPGSNGTAVIHWRPDAVTEAVAQLRFLTHGQPRVRHTMLAFRPPFEAAAAAVVAGLAAMGLPPPVTVNLTAAPSAAAAAAMVAGAYATAAKTPHGVMLLLDDPADVVAAVLGVVGAGGLPNTTFFTAPSFATLPLWKYPVNGAWTALPFATLFHASSIPHYADARFSFASKFRAAARAYGGAAGAVPSLAGISGYAAARVALSAIDRVPRGVATITRPVVLQTMYELGTIRLDDWQVGPLAAGCSGYQRPDGDTCSCNSGGRVVFTTRVNETTGLTEPWKETPNATFNSAEVTVPPLKCGIDPPTVLKTPHTQVSYFDHLLPQSTLALQYYSLQFAGGLVGSSYVENTVRKHLYALGYATQNITRHQIDVLTDRYAVFLQLATSSVDMRAAMATPALPLLTFAESRSTYYDADPDTTPYDQWNPNYIPLLPTLADFAHTAAAYATNLGRGGSVHIVADTAVLASLARRSVETHASAAPASVRVLGPLANVTVQDVLPRQGGDGAFIMVVSQNPLLLRAAQKAAVQVKPVGAIVALCTSEFVLPQALEPTAAAATNVVFAAGLPTYTGDGANGNPINAYGAVYGRFVVAFANLDTGTASTAQASIDALYSVGSVSASGISVGPLSKTDCGLTAPTSVRPAGQCQCSKGLTTFHMRNITSWAIALGATALGSPVVPSDGRPLFSYRLPDCGVRYTALPPEETGLRGTALLLTVTGSTVAAVAIVGVTAFVLYYSCVVRVTIRDTSAAPKDESKPFAMVFTDIQASTTLWAHAPHAMGPALDTHHRVVRRLIDECKGYEVKTIGDSFMVAFQDMAPALDFALAVQGSLYEHDWGTDVLDSTYRQLGFGAVPVGSTTPPMDDDLPDYDSLWNGLRVRVGVHYGEGSIKLDDTSHCYDYYGTVVNTAARVEGVGHGGQVLVTEAAIQGLAAVGADLPPCAVLDLGPQRLRGLSDAVHLTQLLPEALAARSFPPLRLEIEINVADEAEDAPGTTDEATTPGREYRRSTLGTQQQDHPSDEESSSNALEAVATRLACGNVQSTPQAVLFAHEVLHRAVAPLSPKDQLAFANKVAGAWRVPAEPPFTGALRRSARSLAPQELLMVQVAARALQAATSAGGLFANAPGLDGRRKSPDIVTALDSVSQGVSLLAGHQGSRRVSASSSNGGVSPVMLPTPKHISTHSNTLHVPGLGQL